MRQHLSRPRAFALFMMVLLLSILAPECRAAEATKQDDTPLRVKIVEIKGTKVRLPIPDGYEEMKREDHPETYDWMVEVTEGVGRLPLAYLINSSDKNEFKKNINAELRIAIAFSDIDFCDAVISENSMRNIRGHFLKYTKDLAEGVNQLQKEDNGIEMSFSIIYDGKKSISSLHLGKENEVGKQFRTGITDSYIVLDKKIVALYLDKKISSAEDIDSIKKETITYLEKIDRGCY